jgi:hypothetical protein
VKKQRLEEEHAIRKKVMWSGQKITEEKMIRKTGRTSPRKDDDKENGRVKRI